MEIFGDPIDAEVLIGFLAAEAGVGPGGVGLVGPLLALRLDVALRDQGMPVLLGVVASVFSAWLAWLAWRAWPAMLRLHRRNPGEAGGGVFARPGFALRPNLLASGVAFGVFAHAARAPSVADLETVLLGRRLRVHDALLHRWGLQH